ncbi:phytanoyl-CoA dioxygenase family protein [Archangium sp.]|uniref:phytanoyl-CoA dioxygenase family protein n=1 Tax=Archangium sp. TaxID=1872627 RepID=UPI002D41BF44|nr:phytanoyl-CoA dioxygenase family protein [Archangium sp.]HYO58564.1 phytanoyl-CoA dioxygenase family protein [Archangium sp.]
MTSLPRLVESHPLADAEVTAFRTEGHIQLRGVFTADEIAAYRPALRDYIMRKREQMRPGDRNMGASPSDTVFSLSDAPEAIADFVTSPRLGELAARLMDVTAVRLLHFCGFFKPSGGPPTPWHQDLNFIPLDSDRALSIWIPLMDVTPDMGGLLFAQGSHQQGPQSSSVASRFPIASNGPMRAGDISLHMGWTLHASLKNSSSAMREAIAVCYYADGARVGGNSSQPFSQHLMTSYFAGLRPGDPAVGPMNPVVFRRSDAAK